MDTPAAIQAPKVSQPTTGARVRAPYIGEPSSSAIARVDHRGHELASDASTAGPAVKVVAAVRAARRVWLALPEMLRDRTNAWVGGFIRIIVRNVVIIVIAHSVGGPRSLLTSRARPSRIFSADTTTRWKLKMAMSIWSVNALGQFAAQAPELRLKRIPRL